MSRNVSPISFKVFISLILLSNAVGVGVGILSAKVISDAQINESWWRLRNATHILTSGSCFMPTQIEMLDGQTNIDLNVR